MKNFRIISEFYSDMREATDWYGAADVEVAVRLVNEFYAALPKITAHPLAHPAVYKEFRRVWLKPFSYFVYYRVDDDGTVVITLLFHTSRNPRTSRELLDQRRFL